MSEMKNAIEKIGTRVDQRENRISYLEDRNFEKITADGDCSHEMKRC